MNPLEEFKFWLQDNLDDLKDACKSDAHRLLLNEMYRRVTESYEACVNRILVPGNEEALALTEKLTAVQDEVDDDLSQLDDIESTLNKIATGVKIASKIAILAIQH
jgi:hypothetical protein